MRMGRYAHMGQNTIITCAGAMDWTVDTGTRYVVSQPRDLELKTVLTY